MKLFLLILDSEVNDYYLHGVFDDTVDGREAISQIISEGCGYQIIKGIVIERGDESYDDDYDDDYEDEDDDYED